MSRRKWTMKRLKLKKRRTFLRNQLCLSIPKLKRSEMTSLTTLLSKRQSKRVAPICSSKPKESIRILPKRRLTLRTILMRSLEYVLIIWIVSSRMTCWRRSWMTLSLNLKIEKRKCMTLNSKLRRDIMSLIRSSLESTSSIGFGPSSRKREVMMKTQVLWRPRKITLSSSLKNLKTK